MEFAFELGPKTQVDTATVCSSDKAIIQLCIPTSYAKAYHFEEHLCIYIMFGVTRPSIEPSFSTIKL